jgi:hypothetical protein
MRLGTRVTRPASFQTRKQFTKVGRLAGAIQRVNARPRIPPRSQKIVKMREVIEQRLRSSVKPVPEAGDGV